MRRMTRLGLGIAVLLWAIPADAQSARRDGNLDALNECITLDVNAMGTASIQLSQTWAGTVTWYVSNGGDRLAVDLATPSAPGTAVNSATANGGWSGSVAGWREFVACMTSYTSGEAGVRLSAAATGGGGGAAAAGGGLTDTELRATAVPVSATNLDIQSGGADLATAAQMTTLDGRVDGVEALLTTIDTDTGAIDGKLPSVEADDGSIAGAQNALRSAALLHVWTGSAWARAAQVVDDVCATGTKINIPISVTTGTQLIAGTASNRTYICSIQLITATAQNIAIVSGTGTVCDTSPGGIFGGVTAATGWNFAANGGLTLGNGAAWIGKSDTDADNICLLTSSTGQISGNLTYVVAAN